MSLRWLDTMMARPAVERGLTVARNMRSNISQDEEAKKVLFGQRAQ
jgi:GST-like protein